MPLVEWNESFSVNVAEIDDQHRELILTINKLYDAMKAGKEKTILAEIIDRLRSYIDVHFSYEEKHFDKFGYDKREEHKKEHLEFVEKVEEFEKNFDEGSVALSVDIMNYLNEWLSKHIKGSDKKYSKLFNEKGLH